MSRFLSSASDNRDQAGLPKLSPVSLHGSAAGAWTLTDHPGMFVFRYDDGAWTAWAAPGSSQAALLDRHGLADADFATRRETLQALSAILDLHERPEEPHLLLGFFGDLAAGPVRLAA